MPNDYENLNSKNQDSSLEENSQVQRMPMNYESLIPPPIKPDVFITTNRINRRISHDVHETERDLLQYMNSLVNSFYYC